MSPSQGSAQGLGRRSRSVIPASSLPFTTEESAGPDNVVPIHSCRLGEGTAALKDNASISSSRQWDVDLWKKVKRCRPDHSVGFAFSLLLYILQCHVAFSLFLVLFFSLTLCLSSPRRSLGLILVLPDRYPLQLPRLTYHHARQYESASLEQSLRFPPAPHIHCILLQHRPPIQQPSSMAYTQTRSGNFAGA